MGNADSIPRNDKLDFLQPQQLPQAKLKSQTPTNMDETVYHQPTYQRTHSPKPVQRIPSTQQQQPYPQQQFQPYQQQQIPQQQAQSQQIPQLAMGMNQQPPQNYLNQQDPRLNFQHPHLLRTLGSQAEGDQVRYYFEYCPITLQSLVQERVGTKRYFPEEDLQAIMLGVSSALSFLYEQGISHGDICASEIFFDQPSSSFKILDSGLINGRGGAILQTLQGRPSSHLAPELHLSITTQSPQSILAQLTQLPELVLAKNDVWCLGAVILKAALLLNNLDDIYCGPQIRNDILHTRIQEVAALYSREFAQYLANLLNSNYDQRPDPVTLFAYFTTQLQQQEQASQLPPHQIQPQLQQTQQQLQMPPPQQKQLIYPQQYPLPQESRELPPQRRNPSPLQPQRNVQQPPIGLPQQNNIPIRQIVKQIVYPDGRVEYKIEQPQTEEVQPYQQTQQRQVLKPQRPSSPQAKNHYQQQVPILMVYLKNIFQYLKKHEIQQQDVWSNTSMNKPQQVKTIIDTQTPYQQEYNPRILSNIENQIRVVQATEDQPIIKGNENSYPAFDYSNIQRLKQEIEQSKMLIQQYQIKSEQQSRKIPSNEQSFKNESIEDRIRKVIAQSQALRENFS